MNEAIQNTVEALKKGHLIVYPTDTVWGIGCDATDSEAVKKVCTLKKRPDTKGLICLVSDIYMLERYVGTISDAAYDSIAFTDRPLTIIYPHATGIAENLSASDGSLAVRVVRDEFCRELIEKFGKPVVSTSANLSGQPTPGSFGEISDEILKGADYIVDLYHDKKCNQPSSIIKIGADGLVETIRK